MRIATAALLASLTLAGAARAQSLPDTGFKSPTVAGVTSYLLPGVGSWYAGNEHHARVHGAIALGLGLTGMLTSAGSDCYDMCIPPTLLGAVFFFGYVTNDIWSIVTAVRDAHSRNDRTEQLRSARVDFTPALRLAAPAGDATRSRLDVQLLRATF
jgi:hypothetical protein